MCSPYRTEFIKRVTKFSYARAEASARKVSISSSVGGRPVRSNVTRRISVSLSAESDSVRPCSRIRRRINRSRLFLDQRSRLTVGTSGSLGVINDQCLLNSAPSFTHCSRSLLSLSDKSRFESVGGMTRSGSLDVILAINSLLPGFPATMIGVSPLPLMPSAKSSLRSACRAFASGPWHWKQFSERIGRICRLKSILS